MMVNVLTGEAIREEDVMNRTISASDLINYLRGMMDDFMMSKERYGMDDRETRRMLDEMIVCKEMVERLIDYPVNLRKDGTVTIGF